MAITIVTRLHSDVSGGGVNRVCYQWATGPRNLMKAIKCLGEHRQQMRSGYGNIGCGRSWLEIDGVAIPQGDLANVMVDDVWAYGPCATPGLVQTCTQKARELIIAARLPGYGEDQ